MRLLPLLALACWSPKDTGPRSMVGTLVDPQGLPIAGVVASTLESQWTTEPDGRFAVNYKEPGRWVRFTVDGLTWQRAYTPEDDGTRVEVRLAPTRTTPVRCEASEPCQATLRWRIDERLEARASLRCAPGGGTLLPAAPLGVPTDATCLSSPTASPQALVVALEGGEVLVLGGSPSAQETP